MQKYITSFLFYFVFVLNSYSQRCGSHILSEKLSKDSTFVRNQQRLNKLSAARLSNTASNQIYTIPVVVHVLYNNSNQNISDAQILSQIDILNQDYRLLNSNFSSTPNAFVPLAGDAFIQFALAKKDPDGLPTNGITRTFTSKSSFQFNDDMKSTSSGGIDPWNTSKYLNLWICELAGGVLGFAYPPGVQANIDGVVINTTSLGNTGNVVYPYNLGRTATHEIGHYLNLKHVWGDANCGDDGVSDTPTQQTSNDKCPTYPHSTCSNTSDMYVNYMDYTYDECMTMFSKGQIARMRTAIENARQSLLTSDALGDVTIIKNDAGIKRINNYNSEDFLCTDSLAANVTLFNYGADTLKNVKIKILSNNQNVLNYKWFGNLASLNSIDIVLPTISILKNATISIFTELPNAVSDTNNVNDTTNVNVTIVKTQSIPFVQDFESNNYPDSNWTILNPDNDITWEWANVGANNSAKSLVLKNYDYTDQNGQLDYYVSPRFKVLENAKVTFDYAYQVYSSSMKYGDSLMVLYSADCGITKNELFKKGGSELTTAGFSTISFVPIVNQWTNKSISLTSLVGQTIQLYFVNKCDYENNLYLDNINVTSLTGIENVENELFAIYPNPTENVISLNGAELNKITIFDLSGKLMVSNVNQNSIDVSLLSNGLYIFKGEANNGQALIKKFEKK